MQETKLVSTDVNERAIINIGTIPQTAEEIYNYVKNALVIKATPLKQRSIELHDKIIETLPSEWEKWDIDDITLATAYYDILISHLKLITDKTHMTEFDDLRDKAHKLKIGIIDAIKDVVGPLSSMGASDWTGDKEDLTIKIRKWRNVEEEKAKAEALKLMKIAKEQEDERRLQEALELQTDAIKLSAMGEIEQAAEIMKEAETLIEEQIFIPPPVIQNTIPKGGPKRQKFWKFKVNLILLIKGIVAGRVPINAIKADEVLIGNQVRKLKNNLKWDGVDVWPE